MSNNSNKYLKRAFNMCEAAEYSCVSRGTLTGWITNGLLPCEELPGRGDGSHKFRLIRKLDLDEFLEKHYQSGRSRKIKNKSANLLLWEQKP